MKSTPFRFGIDTLCGQHADWLKGRRVALVANPASRSVSLAPSANLLVESGVNLVGLFGPEHGYNGRANAGEAVANARHPELHIPVYSLYGHTRKPTAAMLKDVDVLVFDLQDLGARPYTFVSTLRYLLEAAAERGKTVVVADRPSPLAAVVDGPMLDPAFESFVGMVPAPVVYGMTPGETACWLKNDLKLDLDLHVAPVTGYQRNSEPTEACAEWVPPSPAILSRQCALCFPITVFLEALPAIDHGRGTDAPFQHIGAPWLDSEALCRDLQQMDFPGIEFTPGPYRAMTGAYKGKTVKGVTIRVIDASMYLPVQTAVGLIGAIQQRHGREALWQHAETREKFFDQLMGTDSVRRAIQGGRSLVEMTPVWALQSADFWENRKACLLY